MRRISLQRRMIAASVVLALLVGGVFVALILALAALREAREDEARSKDVTREALGLERQVLEVDSGLSTYVITNSPVLRARYQKSRSELEGKLKSFRRVTSREPQAMERTGRLFVLVDRYTDYLNLVTRLARESIGAAREATRDESSEQLGEIQDAFGSFLVAEDALTESRKDAADARFTHAVELGVAGLTGSAALILLFAFYLSRSIARPVREAATGATQLAGGDLSLRLSQSGPGEIGELTTAFNRMAESLQRARVELEQQNAQLRDSERLKSDLVNTVSHELRTPLSGVLGFTKLLLTREFDSETRRHYLGIVDAQARRLSQLIDDFLDVRAIEEGRFDPARDLVDLGTLLQDEATLYSLQSERHELALDLPDTSLPVMGNADRLRQVIGNLLSNAIKYSPQGGLVQVTAGMRGDAVRFEVRDEGIGIPTEQQARIFTKFFRADAAASGITGTGLGLAVSRDIVESHGGQIGFMSAEGEGTTFFVELPGADSSAENKLQNDPADRPRERTSR